MPTATIDRFEDDQAVLAMDGREQVIARSRLPKDAREGDVVDLATLTVDPAATAKLKDEIAQARAKLRQETPKDGKLDL